jgi:hypothetical protein
MKLISNAGLKLVAEDECMMMNASSSPLHGDE